MFRPLWWKLMFNERVIYPYYSFMGFLVYVPSFANVWLVDNKKNAFLLKKGINFKSPF